MTRYWVVGGEYEGSDFRSLVPGSERVAGPFENERKARNEWIRLTYCPNVTATTRYSITSEGLR
jgi:hypothetical protein